MLELNNSNFQATVSSDTPTVVDFYANWCGPCRMLAPVFKRWAEDHHDKATFAKLNVDDSTVSESLKVEKIPTVIVFKVGKETKRWIGMPNEGELLDAIN